MVKREVLQYVAHCLGTGAEDLSPPAATMLLRVVGLAGFRMCREVVCIERVMLRHGEVFLTKHARNHEGCAG